MSKQYTVGLRFTADASAVSSAITTTVGGLQELRSQAGATGQSVLGLGQALDTSGQQAQRFGAHAETAGGGADRLGSALGRVAHYGLAGVGLHAVAQAVFSTGQALFQASARAQSLATQLNFATDGRSAQELAFVGSVADKLGLQLSSTAQAYAGFAAAARGTALEGAPVRTVFESIAKASAVMGLSAEQSSGALLAVQQMMGKGVVSAEEFRGQLGERMPIALQAGAQALGVTTSEFSKLLESGQIVAQDFLPKFAAAIDKLLAGSVEEAANRLDASAQRMGNAWEKLKKTVGDSGVSQAIGTGMTAVSHDMNAFSEAMDRAKERGGGFLAQINQGLGVMIGRAVGLNYLSDAFRSNAERASHLASELPKAEAELAALQARGAATSENIYLRSSYFDALRYTEELRAAKRAQDALKGATAGGGRGVVNPTTVGAALEQKQRDSESANALRLKLAGVPDGYLKDMQEIIRLNQAGALTGKEYTDALAQQQAALLKKTDATHGAATGQKELQSSYESFLTGLNQKNAAQRQELDTGKKVSESDQLRIKFQELLGTSLSGLGAQQRKTIEQGLGELAVGEKLAQQAKQAAEIANARVDARRQESQGIAQWLADREAAAQKGLTDVRERINALAIEEDAARLAASSNVSLAEAVELVAIARLQEAQAAKFYEGSEGWQSIEREIAARRELLGLVRGKEAREGFKKTAEEAGKELKRVTEQYEQGLTNAAIQGGKSLREYIQGMLRATAFRIILDPIMKPLAGVLASVTGGSSASSAAAGNGGVTGIANTLSSAYSALTNGVSSSIAAGFAKLAGSGFGQSLGLSNSAAIMGNNPSA
ncbi:MAG: tape measure protein, partial [Burkholderiaceae bacterium]|nr:tape measure protein [Burkholderiaceae bacterium]